jgi:aldose 1-epimerase
MSSPFEPKQSSMATAVRASAGSFPQRNPSGPSPATGTGVEPILSSRRFGVLPTGEAVDAWTLKGRGGLEVEAIPFGGIVTRILAPGRNGALDDVVLGFNNLESYLAGHPHFGAITGRIAGRIAGAAFTLDGQTYRLAQNDGPNHLHGGRAGFDKRLWDAAPVDRPDGAPSLRLSYLSPDGEENYPGNVRVAVTYTVTNDNVFLIETEASSDRLTLLSLTHHSYFNLADEGSGSIEDHRVTVFADHVVPTDDRLILTGRIEPVRPGVNDLRQPHRLRDVIPLLNQHHGDLYALPAHNVDELVEVARVEELTTGRILTVSTTERYLQLYTGSHLDGTYTGKSGKAYGPHAALCLECEGYADASNESMRGDILLYPGQVQRHRTAYAFSVEPESGANQIKYRLNE